MLFCTYFQILSICACILSWQRSHNAFKCDQGHGICWKCSQKARQETPPISFRTAFPVHSSRSLPPIPKPRGSIIELSAHGIRHDALFDNVTRIAGEPENLSAQPTGPEVDGRGGQARAFAQQPREHIVRAPPEEEKGSEEEGRGKALVHAPQAVGAVDFAHAVERAPVQTLGLASRVLDLQARLDVFDGRGDEGDGGPGRDARDAVAGGREVGYGVVGGVRLGRAIGKGRAQQPRREYVLGEQPPVDGQAAQHQRVHEHPADQRGRRALVESPDALVAQGLGQALEGPAEARWVGRLEPDFDGVEGMADWRAETG